MGRDMVPWSSQNVRQNSSSFAWHQPWTTTSTVGTPLRWICKNVLYIKGHSHSLTWPQWIISSRAENNAIWKRSINVDQCIDSQITQRMILLFLLLVCLSFVFICCCFLLFLFLLINIVCNNHNVVIFKLWKKERLISQVVMKIERHMDTPPFLEP